MELQVVQGAGGYWSMRAMGDGTVRVGFHITVDTILVLARRDQLPVRIVYMRPSQEVYFRWVAAKVYSVEVKE